MTLISIITVALVVYVLRVKRFTSGRENALRLCVSALTLVTAAHNVYLLVHDALGGGHVKAIVDAIGFGCDVFVFRVFWSGLGVRFFREKAGVLAPGRVWVFMIDAYMHINPSLFGLAREVVTEWSDDKHLVS